LFESADLNSLGGLSMKTKVFERNVGTRDELLARILGAVAPIKERAVQLKTNNTRSVHMSC